MLKILSYLEPGESRSFEVELVPGIFGACDRITRAETVFQVDAVAPFQPKVRVVMGPQDYEEGPRLLGPGRTTFEFVDQSGGRASVFAVGIPAALLTHPPLVFEPFLSANRLLASQTFRRLFAAEALSATDGIKINDLTILFTDLKGSIGLYDRIGDLKAFGLVQQHFEALGRVIGAHGGATVKTIGDAVMACFPQPRQAVAAALEMLREIERFNRERGADDIVLKIGIHKGPSIAVTLNDRLDYFGQNVNIASRVQALAEAEEVYVTSDVYACPGIADMLKGCVVTPPKVALRGVGREVQVYKIAPDRSPAAA